MRYGVRVTGYKWVDGVSIVGWSDYVSDDSKE